MLLRLRGPVDPDRLAGALATVVARHEALRCRFPQDDDGRPQLRIAPPGPVELPVVEAVGDSPADREAHARALVTAELGRPFDLAVGPPLRALLVVLDAGDAVLVLATHHIASDGWSSDILAGELLAAYGGATLPPLAVQYGDYAIWQRQRVTGAVRDADVAYWRSALAGLEPLALPTDRPRPPRQTYRGADHTVTLDAALHGSLVRLGREHRATLYMVLLAAVQAVLARHSGQTDLAVGSPVAGRTQPELEPLIGMFVNMLTLRADLSGDPTFAGALARTRETCLDAYAHQEVPFEQLVNELKVTRDVTLSPLFQVLFALQNYAAYAGPAPDGLTVEDFALPAGSTRFDLEIYAYEAADGLALTFIYNVDLFDAATVERFARHLRTFLAAVVATPDRPVSTVDLLAPDERTALVATAPAVPLRDGRSAAQGDTLAALVAATCERTPDAVAVTFDGRHLTYRELDRRSAAVAARLRELGAGPGTLVAVCAERSADLVVGLLGVLRAGAAYVPLDPEYPADRLAFMLADTAAPIVLTQGRLRAALPAVDAEVLLLDDPWPPASSVDGGPDPGDVAYVIYTSGSTGRPKGVPNTHRGIVNRLDWMQRTYRLTAGDVVLQKTPASFDVSVWEFFWPLLAGARLVLAKPGGHKDAEYLRDLIAAEGVTTVHFVPSMLNVFLGADGVGDASPLRRIICSGEELPADLAGRCLALLPGAGLHNLYGPTEAAVDVTAFACTVGSLAGQARVPIGRPIQNITLYVLDAHLRPAPVGVPGQLFIAGVGLALGYLNRPALTAERFLPDPYGPAGSRMYRTGDLARWRPDGDLDFLGRIDAQVKLRGLRIELGEIEAALRGQPGVRDAAVVVREDTPGDRRIAAYLVGQVDPAEVRAALKRRLPDYMVPSAIVELAELPLSPSGKLDRRALPVPTFQRAAGAELVAPSTPTELLLADIWRELIGVPTLGVDDDFFDLGGHSLLATQVVARLRRALGAGVSVLDVFAHPTIRSLATLIDTPLAERGPRPLLHELTRPSSGHTLSVVCVPYGGGSAVIYQPLADALPPGSSLYSLAIPGNDIGLDETALPFDELLTRASAEVLEKVTGPLVLYGHCVGSAITIELARRLEAAGREVEAVYVGATFPFARPTGPVLSRLAKFARGDRLRGNRVYENWLRSMGVELATMEPAEADAIVRNMRNQANAAEDYFTDLFERQVRPLRAPVISVVGERDPETDFYRERYREWQFLSPRAALVVLAEGGHYFLNYRAAELADIVTTVHRTEEKPADPDGGWAVLERSATPTVAARSGPEPSMRRFLVVAACQMVSIVGSSLTEFAIPLWIYLQTGSLVRFALFAVLGLLPGMLVAPLAGAIVDRYDRRRVMIAGDLAAGGSQAVLLLLAVTGRLEVGHIYGLLVVLSVALTFQRLAYASAVPQLVPKRFLGHANGVVQMATGVGQFLVPLAAAALLAGIGLTGILLLDAASYLVAVLVVLAVRFPDTLPWRRHESLGQEIVHGLRFALRRNGFLPLLGFFAVLNVFLAPPFLLLSPLVLAFGDLAMVARVSMAAGLGAIAAGALMTFWGGPRRDRTRGMLGGVVVLAASCVLAGLQPVEPLVAVAAFGMSFGLTLTNGIYATIVQIKVPQRYHGRVFAVNTVVAFSTIPVAYGLIAPYGSRLLEPLLAPGGALAGTVGRVIGVGPGRGIALMCILFGLAMVVQALVSLRIPAVGRFDERVPDALPDDLVGARARASRRNKQDKREDDR